MFEVTTKKSIWEISNKDFPQSASEREKLRFLIGYAVLAPSSHNTQPWRFRISGELSIEIYADSSRRLKVADKDQRELYLSIGCALENLLIAAEHFGYQCVVEYFPQTGNEEFVARVCFQPNPQISHTPHARLFRFITERATFHGAFANAPVSEAILREIYAFAEEAGVNLYLTDNEEIRRRADDLIARSDAMQFADPEFRQELAYWIGKGAFGNSWLMSQIGSLATAYLNLGKATARGDSKALHSAPVMGLITSLHNDRRSQVKAGQVFERIYLTAREYGIGVRPMSQICQIPEHKEELKNLLGLPNNHPQQPFLLGYAEFTGAHTPRRSVEEVLF